MLNDSPLHEFFPDGLMGTIATYTYSASGARWELHLGRDAFLGCVALYRSLGALALWQNGRLFSELCSDLWVYGSICVL